MSWIATRNRVLSGGWRITNLSRPYLFALAKLARSSWGDTGIGACPNKKTGTMLISLGLAKRHKKQDGHNDIYQISYRGYQLLERMRWDAILKSKRTVAATWPMPNKKRSRP